jgi:succinate dehydrogenase/fumarate reductase flavoprotein subunit
MAAALLDIQDVRERIGGASGSGGPIYNAPWNEAINTVNLSLIAEMLTTSALAREESRGAHYRSDFTEKEVQWLKNICMTPRDDGGFDMTFAPVEFTRLAPPEPEAPNMGLKTVVSLIDE